MTDRVKTGFVVMAKPVGALCNLRCRYCYYLDAETRRGGKESLSVMSDEVLETFIRQYFEDNPGPAVQFNWHGGEPTLAGLDFYRRAVALQKKYCPEGWEVWNNIQTNGVLLDDAWCDFIAENHFDVGISIDGTEMIHDTYRLHPDGSPSYAETADAIRRLMARGVQPDLLCTVTEATTLKPDKIYRALKSFGTGWMQFIPIVVKCGTGEDGEPIFSEESVTAASYGRFLNAVFDEWISHDLGVTDVQLFAETARMLAGGEAHLCTLAEECGRVPVLEHDGKVYACDHFVDEAHCLGNILDGRISEMLDTEKQRQFGEGKRTELPETCLRCPAQRLCKGGCKKDRFLPDGRHVLCDGMRMYFMHAAEFFPEIMEMSRHNVPRGNIMAAMRTKLKKSRK